MCSREVIEPKGPINYRSQGTRPKRRQQISRETSAALKYLIGTPRAKGHANKSKPISGHEVKVNS